MKYLYLTFLILIMIILIILICLGIILLAGILYLMLIEGEMISQFTAIILIVCSVILFKESIKNKKL